MLKPIDRYSLGTCGHLLYFLPWDKDVALLMLNLVQNQESLIVFAFKQKMIHSVGKFFEKGLETVNMKGECGSKTCTFLSHQDRVHGVTGTWCAHRGPWEARETEPRCTV